MSSIIPIILSTLINNFMEKWSTILDLAKCFRRKMYIDEMMARSLCPTAKITRVEEPNMMTYEIMYDSLEKFFRENDVTSIFIESCQDQGPLGLINATTVIVKCSIGIK